MAQNSFVIAHTNGAVAVTDNGGSVSMRTRNQQLNQWWTVEKGGNPNTVAFKNVQSGQYLLSTNPNGGNMTRVGTGGIQWWTLLPRDNGAYQ